MYGWKKEVLGLNWIKLCAISKIKKWDNLDRRGDGYKKLKVFKEIIKKKGFITFDQHSERIKYIDSIIIIYRETCIFRVIKI